MPKTPHRRPTVTAATYRGDPLYPRIERAVATILQHGTAVAPVDVLVGMALLTPEHLEDWRRGRVRYLQQVINCNLTRDGVAAVALAAEGRFDVAVIDIALPVMDGYEVARRLRTSGHDGMTLLAVTGYGQAEDRQRAHDAGFDAHVVKPVDAERLLRLLAETTGRGGRTGASPAPAR